MSTRALAAVLGVSAATAHRDLRRLDAPRDDGMAEVVKVRGLDGKIRPSRRLDTTERDAAIVSKRAAGLTVRQIAGALGCSVGTVHRVLKADH